MKVKSKLLVLTLGALVFSNACADMFCPNSFNSINIGDTIDAVIAACGKPDSQTSNKKTNPQPQEWAYFIAASNNPSQPGTMKLTVAFDASGSVINISVNGSGMPQTQLCNNTMIQLGDNMKAVEAACGKPAMVNQTQQPVTPEPETEITTMIYNGTPSVTFTFENGKLTSRQ